jgi:hypothetical protein
MGRFQIYPFQRTIIRYFIRQKRINERGHPTKDCAALEAGVTKKELGLRVDDPVGFVA